MLGNKNQSHRGGRGIGKDERQGVPKQPYEGNRIPFLFSRAEWPHREWFPAQPCIEGSVFQHSLVWPLCRARLLFVRLLHGSRRPHCRFSGVLAFFLLLRARLPCVRLLHGSRGPNCRFSKVLAIFLLLRCFHASKGAKRPTFESISNFLAT